MSYDPLAKLQTLIQEESFEEAREFINEIQSSLNGEPMFHYLKAFTCFRLGELDESIKSYQASIRLDPASCASYSDLGYVLLTEQRWDEAEFLIKKAVSMNPSDPLGVERLGLLYYSMGEFEAAEESFQVLIQLGQDSARIYFFLGELYVHLEEYEKALESYDKCLALEPDQQDAIFGKALAYEEQGEYSAAITIYQSLLEKMEDGDEILQTLLELGTCYFKAEQFEEAYETYRKALQLDPEDPILLNNLGLLCLEFEDPELAEQFLGESIKQGESFENLFNLARCHLINERFQLALSHFRKSLRLADSGMERAQCHFYIGHSYLCLKKPAQAFRAYISSLEKKGNEVDLYLEFLEVAEELKRLEEALEFLKGLRTKGGNYYHSLFLFHISRVDTDSALKILGQGLKKFPGEPIFYYYKATAYAVAGKHRFALNNLELACKGDPDFVKQAVNNACFTKLREQPEFDELLQTLTNPATGTS